MAPKLRLLYSPDRQKQPVFLFSASSPLSFGPTQPQVGGSATSGRGVFVVGAKTWGRCGKGSEIDVFVLGHVFSLE